MLFVADEIPDELRRVVEFLNVQTDPAEVLAVEIKQYEGEGQKTLVPRVYGQTVAARQKKSGARAWRKWDEASFFEQLRECQSEEEEAIVKKLYGWSQEHMPDFWWGEGAQWASWYPGLLRNGVHYYPIAVWARGGRIEARFGGLQNRPPFDDAEKRREFCRVINEIPGVTFEEDKIDLYPSFYLKDLKGDAAYQKLIEALEWFGKTVEEASGKL